MGMDVREIYVGNVHRNPSLANCFSAASHKQGPPPSAVQPSKARQLSSNAALEGVSMSLNHKDLSEQTPPLIATA
jgi:hypothetical protein